MSAGSQNLAIMEREAREARERQALRATQEQREQQEGQEQERQHLEEQQRTSGKSSPSINSASVYYRLGRENDEEQQRESDQSLNTASVYYRVNPLCPCSPAARARRAVGAGSAAVASLILKMFRKSRSEKAPQLASKSTPEGPKMTPNMLPETRESPSGGSKIDPRSLPKNNFETRGIL